MPSTTDLENVVLDYEHGATCPHCGEVRPMCKIPCAFTSGGWMNVGIAPCNCEGAAAEVKAKIAAELLAEQKRQEEADRRRFDRAGIPLRYRGAEHPWARKMAVYAKAGQSFYLHGPNGTRKTTLAMAAARCLLSLGADVFVVSTYDLMDAMRSRKDEDRSLFDRAASCGVLILDDLGKEASNTPYSCERLFAIIDTRYKNMLPLIATSNYKLSDLACEITTGDVGVAIASRLAEVCKQLAIEGDDMRLFGGDQNGQVDAA